MKHSHNAAFWMERCRNGSAIPRVAIVDFELNKYFDFTPAASKVGEFYIALREKNDGETQVDP